MRLNQSHRAIKKQKQKLIGWLQSIFSYLLCYVLPSHHTKSTSYDVDVIVFISRICKKRNRQGKWIVQLTWCTGVVPAPESSCPRPSPLVASVLDSDWPLGFIYFLTPCACWCSVPSSCCLFLSGFFSPHLDRAASLQISWEDDAVMKSHHYASHLSANLGLFLFRHGFGWQGC